MRSRKTVDQWRTAVYRSPSISDAVRVYLLKLADHMAADRTVSVPRTQLARELNRHEQRIAERTTEAVIEGFLAVVSAGYKGHTAIYQGTFPVPVEVEKRRAERQRKRAEADRRRAVKRTDLQYAKDPLERYAIAGEMSDKPGQCVPDGEYASSKRPPSGSAVGDVPNEEQRRRGADGQTRSVVRAAFDQLALEARDQVRSA